MPTAETSVGARGIPWARTSLRHHMQNNSFVSMFKSEKGNLSIVFTVGNIDYTVFGTDIAANAVAALKPELEKQTAKSGRVYYRTQKPVSVDYEQVGEVEREIDPDTGKVSYSAFAKITGIAPAVDNLASLANLQF